MISYIEFHWPSESRKEITKEERLRVLDTLVTVIDGNSSRSASSGSGLFCTRCQKELSSWETKLLAIPTFKELNLNHS